MLRSAFEEFRYQAAVGWNGGGRRVQQHTRIWLDGTNKFAKYCGLGRRQDSRSNARRRKIRFKPFNDTDENSYVPISLCRHLLSVRGLALGFERVTDP